MKAHEPAARLRLITVVFLVALARPPVQGEGLHVEEFDLARYVGGRLLYGAVFADLNRDGNLDFVSSHLELLYGDSSGQLLPAETPLPSSTPAGLPIIVADFDNDGWLDIATGNRSQVAILWSVDGLSFEELIVDANRGTQHLQAVDVNRDGKLDLLSADRLGSQQVVWYDLSRSLATAHPVETSFVEPFAAVAGNLDDEPGLELVVSTRAGFHLLDWEDSETPSGGAFVNPMPLTDEDENGRRLALADFDADGDLDIAITLGVNWSTSEESRVVMLWNEGSLTFSSEVLAPILPNSSGSSYYRWIDAVDLDGDGDTDLAVSRYDRPVEITFLLNDGEGNFATEIVSVDGVDDVFTCAIWPQGSGEAWIVPCSGFTRNRYARVSLVRDGLVADVTIEDDQLSVSWYSRNDHVYRLQFSEDGVTWSESYLSGGMPAVVRGLSGTGGVMSHTPAAPDAEDFFVRVIGNASPAE